LSSPANGAAAIFSRKPQVNFLTTGVQPPSRVYIQANENLGVRAWNSVTNRRLLVRGRILRPDGEIIPFQRDFDVMTDDRIVNNFTLPLTEGFLLSCVFLSAADSPRRGQTYIDAGLIRGDEVVDGIFDQLVSGYIEANRVLVWPTATAQSPTEGPGVIRRITGTDPAAGNEVGEAVPTNARWRLLAFLATLVTDATATNRNVTLALSQAGTVYARVFSGVSQTASQTVIHCFIPNLGTAPTIAGTLFSQGHAAVVIPSGYGIATLTQGLQAGDNWGAPQLLVEEWIEE
jgi:hypothetical protein